MTTMPTRLLRSVAAGGCLLAVLATAPPARALDLPDLGHYVGSWINQTFYNPSFPDNATGPVSFTAALTDSTLSIGFDLGGMVFGFADPPPIYFDVPLTIVNDSLTYPIVFHADVVDTMLGDIDGSLAEDGSLSLTISNLLPVIANFGGFDRVEATGTLSGGLLDLVYGVFVVGQTAPYAEGVLQAAHVPEPSSLSMLLLIGMSLLRRVRQPSV